MSSSLNDSQSSRSSRRRWIPGRFMLAVLVLILAAAAWMIFSDFSGDTGMRNVFTGMLVMLAAGLYLLWFLVRSGLPLLARVVLVGAVVAAVVVFLQLYRLETVSGSMIPTFVSRSAPDPDRLLERPRGQEGIADLATTTPFDYPAFLGPGADQRIDGLRLDADWQGQPPEKVWSQPIGAGWAGWAVVNGYGLTLEQRGDEQWVTCYDLEDGSVVWSHALPGRFESVVAGDGPRTTPTVVDGKVVAVGALGQLVVLDGGTGEELWSRQMNREAGLTEGEEDITYPYARSASPLVVELATVETLPAASDERNAQGGDEEAMSTAGAPSQEQNGEGEGDPAPPAVDTPDAAANHLVIVPLGGPDDAVAGTLVAYDLATGEERWRAGEDQIGCASPASGTFGGEPVILSVNSGSVTGHDPASGQELFRHPWPGNVNSDCNVSQPRPLPADGGSDRLFLSKGYGQGAELVQLTRNGADDGFATETLWANARVLRTKFTNVVFHEGYVYGLSDGILECVDLATGKRVWKGGRYGHGQILAVGDVLLVLSEEGEVFAVRLTPDAANEVLGSFEAVAGKTWNPMALSGPYLVVRNAEEAAVWRLPLAPT